MTFFNNILKDLKNIKETYIFKKVFKIGKFLKIIKNLHIMKCQNCEYYDMITRKDSLCYNMTKDDFCSKFELYKEKK